MSNAEKTGGPAAGKSSSSPTVLVTGATSGIGIYTVQGLLERGYRVIFHGRSRERVDQALGGEEFSALSAEARERITPWVAELSDFEKLRAALEEFPSDQLNALVANAGVFKQTREENPSGVEMTLAVNYIANLILVSGLLSRLKKAPDKPARVVLVSSRLYTGSKLAIRDWNLNKKYTAGLSYANSKAGLVVMARKLATGWKSEELTINALHPGVIATGISRELPTWMNKLWHLILPHPRGGAANSIAAVTEPGLANVTGRFLRGKEARPEPLAGELARLEKSGKTKVLEDFWQWSLEQAGLAGVDLI